MTWWNNPPLARRTIDVSARLFSVNLMKRNPTTLLLAVLAGLSGVSVSLAKPGDEANKPEAVPTAETLEPSATEPPKQPAEPAKPQPSPRELPWAKKRPKSEALPILRPPASVREIMEKYDIGESQLTGFFNGVPLSPGEEDVLIRILYRLPRIGLENLEKWRRPEVKLEQLLADSDAHRLDVIPLEGRLTGVAKMDVPPDLAVRLEFKHYYLARIDLPDLGYVALIAIRRVPEYWLTAAELSEPVNLDGIFIKVLSDETETKPQLLFASRRIRWLPDHAIPELHIGADQLRLAELGFDLSLLEDLRTSNKQPIGDLDREPQYQLLDLVGRVPVSKLASNPQKEIDIVTLLKEPEKHQGELMSVKGHARRITKVVVDDPDIRARFGIDHYYEIDIAVDLKEKTIRFIHDKKGGEKKVEKNKNAEDKQAAGNSAENKPGNDAEAPSKTKEPPEDGPIFNNDYPVTVVVRELPPDLKPIDATRQLVRVDAVFMKTWAYRNNYMAQFNDKQVAPLLVGRIPHRVLPPQVYNWVSDVLVGFAITVAALVIGAVFWWFRSADQHIRQTLDELDGRAPQPSFAGLENAPTKPDFSALEQRAPQGPAGDAKE
jgi:hypothetical protein